MAVRNYLVISFFFLSSIVLSQVRGIVVDEYGPLEGAEVQVVDKSTSTLTNENGEFTINAEVGEQLKVINPNTLAEKVFRIVQLDMGELALDDATVNLEIVVGYGRQKKENLTGAVSSVDIEKQLESRPVVDVARGLQGAVAGLTIKTSSGEIGTDPIIRLRGMTGSLNSPNGATPLILVDNVEIQNIQMVNPNNIESISVLKDAASTAIYGTRAAWGVILITTKSGRKNAGSSVTYSNNLSWSTPTELPEVASAYEGAKLTLEALRRKTNNPNYNEFGILGMYYSDESVEKIRQWEQTYGGQNLGDEMVEGRDYEIIGGKLYFYRSFDPMEKFVSDWAPQQKHNLSFSGGGEKTSYVLDLGYIKQQGVFKVQPDQFDKYNANLSVNSEVNPWLDVRGKAAFGSTNLKVPFEYSSAAYGSWYYLLRWPKTYPYGTIDGKPFRSAVTEAQQAKPEVSGNMFTKISPGITLKPIKGLDINLDYTFSWNDYNSNTTAVGTSGINFWGGQLTYLDNYQSASYDYVSSYHSYNYMHTGKAYATYITSLNDDHNFKFMLGMDLDEYKRKYTSSKRNNLLNPDLPVIGLATGDQYAGGGGNHWSTLGYFGRINYNYKEIYLLEASARYDGSSRFPKGEKWALFPSISLGYVISKEQFFDPILDVVSFLKIRGSIGTIGNQAVGENRFLSTIGSYDSNWWIDGKNQLTFSTPAPVSSSLTWERVNDYNLGIDARFFKNKLSTTFELYKRVVSDMIRPGITLPSTYGTGSPVRNFGELTTTGWEFELGFDHTFSNGVHVNLGGNLSDFKEEITKDANVTKGIYSYYEGKVLGDIWGYETDRIYQADDFTTDANGNLVPKDGIDQSFLTYNSSWFNYGPGDIKYKDLNNDGVIDPGYSTVDNHGDLKVIGNSTPRYQYGFRIAADWKGLDLNVFFQGVGKRELWPAGPIFIPGYRSSAEAWYTHQLDYWTEDNTDAYYPRPTENGGSNNKFNFARQTKYLMDMSYLRLKNIQLGYNLPASLMDKIFVKSLRLYISGENLVTWKNNNIPIDPEIDYKPRQAAISFGRTYPYSKTYSVGLQISL